MVVGLVFGSGSPGTTLYSINKTKKRGASFYWKI